MVDNCQDVITSDELREFLEEREDAGELEEEEQEIKEEAQRLLDEYGNDFALIRYSYAKDYVQEFVHDCYNIPKELDWLFFHIDWEGVIRDFLMGGDWQEDDFCGITYYVEGR